MSQLSEIKCPVCGKWCEWTSKIDEKCPNCGAYLDAGRFRYAEEQRITAEKDKQASDLFLKDTNDPILLMLKQFIHWLRWTTIYGVSVIVVIIVIMIVVYGLAMI